MIECPDDFLVQQHVLGFRLLAPKGVHLNEAGSLVIGLVADRGQRVLLRNHVDGAQCNHANGHGGNANDDLQFILKQMSESCFQIMDNHVFNEFLLRSYAFSLGMPCIMSAQRVGCMKIRHFRV